MYRTLDGFEPENARILKLKPQEEFPIKQHFLVEELITKGNARHFLEITGGLLTKSDTNGRVVYEVFEPSEALATGEVLSLEEKFLAGEGQNITPARFQKDFSLNQQASAKVRAELEKVARLLK